MANRSHNPKTFVRSNEEGATTTKFLGVVIFLFLFGYAAFNYLVVWYECTHFKDSTQQIITQAYAMPNQTLSAPENIKQRIRRIGDEDSVPQNAVIKVERHQEGMQAHVTFTREVNVLPFNLFKYKYQYDQVAVPPSMFTIK